MSFTERNGVDQVSFPAITEDGNVVTIVEKGYENGIEVLEDEDGNKYVPNYTGEPTLKAYDDAEIPEAGYSSPENVSDASTAHQPEGELAPAEAEPVNDGEEEIPA